MNKHQYGRLARRVIIGCRPGPVQHVLINVFVLCAEWAIRCHSHEMIFCGVQPSGYTANKTINSSISSMHQIKHKTGKALKRDTHLEMKCRIWNFCQDWQTVSNRDNCMVQKAERVHLVFSELKFDMQICCSNSYWHIISLPEAAVDFLFLAGNGLWVYTRFDSCASITCLSLICEGTVPSESLH